MKTIGNEDPELELTLSLWTSFIDWEGVRFNNWTTHFHSKFLLVSVIMFP